MDTTELDFDQLPVALAAPAGAGPYRAPFFVIPVVATKSRMAGIHPQLRPRRGRSGMTTTGERSQPCEKFRLSLAGRDSKENLRPG